MVFKLKDILGETGVDLCLFHQFVTEYTSLLKVNLVTSPNYPEKIIHIWHLNMQSSWALSPGN